MTRYSSDIRTFTVKHRLTLYSLEFVVNNLNIFLGTIFLLTLNCFFENKKLIVNICSPPVSPDGPNDEGGGLISRVFMRAKRKSPTCESRTRLTTGCQ